MLYVPCAMHYALSTTSRGRAGGRGAFSPSLSPRRGHTKYRVRVRVRVELRRHLLGRSAGPRDEARVARRERERACRLAALPPCRLRSKRAASGERRPRRSAQSAGTRRPRRPPMEARVRRRGTCTPPNRLPRRRRRQQPGTRVRVVAGPGEAFFQILKSPGSSLVA